MIRHMLLALFVLFPSTMSAAPALEPLIHAEDRPAREGCTHDNEICLSIIETADREKLTLELSVKGDAAATQVLDLTGISLHESEHIGIWPQLIRFNGGILAGFESELSTAYSGGGALATQLHLVAFLPGKTPWSPLSVVIGSSASIRACFSEQETVDRAGACHDEYDFAGDLSVQDGLHEGMPVLRYKTTATSFPGDVSRYEDSLERPPLRQSDLVRVEDAVCSFERVFRIDPETALYFPDAPLPDCSDWTVP